MIQDALSSLLLSGENPLVSLVIPSYNAAPYLRAAIESVLEQDYPQIELLVMDGGSTDGTVELLTGYGDRVRWISEKDAGQADAISRGFSLTRGSILGWLNADDLLKAGAIRCAVEVFRANPSAALIYGNADFVDAGGRKIATCTVVEPYSLQRLIYYGDYIIQPAAFFIRQAYEAVGGLDIDLNWAMDWDLWIRLARQYDVIRVDADMASYRWLGSNKTAEGGFVRLEEIEKVARRYGCEGLPAYFRLEKARLFMQHAGRAWKEMRFVPALKNLYGATTVILTSWNATRSLFSSHIWRNYFTAQKLYHHAKNGDAKG